MSINITSTERNPEPMLNLGSAVIETFSKEGTPLASRQPSITEESGARKRNIRKTSKAKPKEVSTLSLEETLPLDKCSDSEGQISHGVAEKLLCIIGNLSAQVEELSRKVSDLSAKREYTVLTSPPSLIRLEDSPTEHSKSISGRFSSPGPTSTSADIRTTTSERSTSPILHDNKTESPSLRAKIDDILKTWGF